MENSARKRVLAMVLDLIVVMMVMVDGGIDEMLVPRQTY